MADKRGRKIVVLTRKAQKAGAVITDKDREIGQLKDFLAKTQMREQALAQMVMEVHNAITGSRPKEGDNVKMDAIFRATIQGIAFLQIEIRRLALSSKTSLFPHEIEEIEKSCLRCAGPKDSHEGKPESVEEAEQRSQWLLASCRSRKASNGVALNCPAFNPQLKEESTDERAQSEPQSGNLSLGGSPVGDTAARSPDPGASGVVGGTPSEGGGAGGGSQETQGGAPKVGGGDGEAAPVGGTNPQGDGGR